MNRSKDYITYAQIIKKADFKTHKERVFVANEFANYFEQEMDDHRNQVIITCLKTCDCWEWNREHFLKRCGVNV